MGVSQQARVADIGAGTGISSRLFLASGHPVVAVEPNAAMRGAAEEWLAPQYRSSVRWTAAPRPPRWTMPASIWSASRRPSIGSTPWRYAPSGSASCAPAARPLIYWNSRLLDASPFLIGYEQLLLDYGTDYTAVAERYQDDATMQAWFGWPARQGWSCRTCSTWTSTPCAGACCPPPTPLNPVIRATHR